MPRRRGRHCAPYRRRRSASSSRAPRQSPNRSWFHSAVIVVGEIQPRILRRAAVLRPQPHRVRRLRPVQIAHDTLSKYARLAWSGPRSNSMSSDSSNRDGSIACTRYCTARNGSFTNNPCVGPAITFW
jgi:hypothetical protein